MSTILLIHQPKGFGGTPISNQLLSPGIGLCGAKVMESTVVLEWFKTQSYLIMTSTK